MAESAYIHIPFCAHKCDFCDFAAFAGLDDLTLEYCQVVASEIKERHKNKPNAAPLRTLFYGGGTPGYIAPLTLKVVHDAVQNEIGLIDGAEVTLETTPKSVTAEKAEQWLSMGINRISIGIESMQDHELQAMGREHKRDECIAGINAARLGGYENIAFDLMYGLPEQTLNSWQETLESLLALKPKHLSAYGLTIAQNSPLLLRYPKDSPSYPSEDTFVQMYETLVRTCAAYGLEQYEIANFAIPGYESQHNLTYWRNDQYLAFGVSAHRYVDGVRSSNFRSLKHYMRDYLGDETREEIDPSLRMKEGIMLGLRLRKGIDLEEFANTYNVNFEERYARQLQELVAGNFIEFEGKFLRLSQKGVLVSNTVLAELI